MGKSGSEGGPLYQQVCFWHGWVPLFVPSVCYYMRETISCQMCSLEANQAYIITYCITHTPSVQLSDSQTQRTEVDLLSSVLIHMQSLSVSYAYRLSKRNYSFRQKVISSLNFMTMLVLNQIMLLRLLILEFGHLWPSSLILIITEGRSRFISVG